MAALKLSILAVTLALGGTAAAAPAPSERGQGFPGEGPSGIPAESDLAADRLDNPQYHFTVDGQHGFVAGREFHQTPYEGSSFLWPAYPFARLMPDRRWLEDSASLTVDALVGNEVGDPLLRELAASGSEDNRAPVTKGGATYAPIPSLRLRAALDQNDHSSQRTFPSRLDAVGPSRREDLSYIGGNLPPKSQIQFGAAFSRQGGMLAGQMNRGYFWTRSPVSGMSYPWEGINADFLYRAGDDFEITLADQSWESASPGTYRAARWRRTEVTLGFAGSSPGGWLWKLEAGGQRRLLEVGDMDDTGDAGDGGDSARPKTALAPFEEDRYPWRFRYRQGWALPDEAAFPLRMETRGSLGYRERIFSAQHAAEFREDWGGPARAQGKDNRTHQLTQAFSGYYRNVFQGYHIPVEFFEWDSAFTAAYRPGRNARGVSALAEYRYRHDTWQAKVSAFHALEWGVPVFRPSGFDTSAGLLLRAGELIGSEHRLANHGARFLASGSLPGLGRAAWKLQGGLRGFQGADADAVEFRPSPWWLGLGGSAEFPSQLKAETMLHWLGPKEVRGWGPTFRVRPHFEANVALSQFLFDERLALSLSFLHAFGAEILEHPNGNPMRFRIEAGLKCVY